MNLNVTEAVHELLRITPRESLEYRVVVCGAGGVGKRFYYPSFPKTHHQR